MIKSKYNLDTLNQYVETGKFTVEKHARADLYIYGYAQLDTDMNHRFKWDHTNINLRGLIVDGEGKVLARSFQKFFTFKHYLSESSIFLTDNQIRKIPPNSKMRIFEKVDGTLTVLYWLGDQPYLSTQRSFKSPKALRATKILHEKYSHLFAKLDRSKTYLFEAIYDETQVLVNYGVEERLYLLGIIDTQTGKDQELEDIGFPMAKEFTDELSNVTNLLELKKLNLPNQEGFVVRYDNGLRVKIKFPWYEKAHKVFNQIIAYKNAAYELENELMKMLYIPGRKLTKRKLWEIFDTQKDLAEIEKDVPDIFYSLGVEEWMNDQHRAYLSYKDKNGNLDLDTIEDEVFDFENRIS